jgi:ribosome recycling factor
MAYGCDALSLRRPIFYVAMASEPTRALDGRRWASKAGKKGDRDRSGSGGSDDGGPRVPFAERLRDWEEALRERCAKAVAHARSELDGVQAGGRADPAVLERLRLADGSSLKSKASVSVRNARSFLVQVMDSAHIKMVEKAIVALQADMQPQPTEFGGLIVPLPKVTQEMRAQLTARCKALAENGKVSLRLARQHVLQEVRAAQKSDSLSKDDVHRAEKRLQEMFDRFSKEVDDLVKAKEKELAA